MFCNATLVARALAIEQTVTLIESILGVLRHLQFVIDRLSFVDFRQGLEHCLTWGE